MNEDQIAKFYKARAKAEQAEALKLLEKAAQKVLGKKKAPDGRGKQKNAEGKTELTAEQLPIVGDIELDVDEYVYQEL
jgi:hypothetical protein